MNFARRSNGQRPEIRLYPLTRVGLLARKVRDGNFSARLLLYLIGKYHLGLVGEIKHKKPLIIITAPSL